MKNNQTQLKHWLAIRRAQTTDADQLSGLVARNIHLAHKGHYTEEELLIWERGYSISAMKEQISHRQVFILLYNNAVCGTIQLDDREIKGLYTDPRGAGFGSILMGFIVSHLRSEGYDWAELSSNRWSVGFYKKHRFKVLEKEIVHWEGHPFEEFRMRRDFTKPSKNDSDQYIQTMWLGILYAFLFPSWGYATIKILHHVHSFI